MAATPFSAATLLAVSARLSTKAKSAAYDIDDLIRDREDETIKTTIDKLCLLSTSLNQLSHYANQVQELLRQPDSASQVSIQELASGLAKPLPECEHALAYVAKQLARLDREVPSQRINVTAVSRFEEVVKATAALYLLLQQLLSVENPEEQQFQLSSTDCQQIFENASSAAKECRKREILLNRVPSGNAVPATSAKQDSSENALPAYSAPLSSPTQAQDGSARPEAASPSEEDSIPNFFTSLARPFKALSIAMKPKPEPLVVPLCEAAARGNIQHIQGLVSEGANVDGYNESGLTPLVCAIRANQLDSMRTLLDAGASRSKSSSGGSSSGSRAPLWHAVDADNEAALDVLLENGASMADDGWFLELVQGRTNAEWVGRLLARGASAHARDASGRTAVVLALERRKKKDDSDEVVKVLLAHGADANARDLYGTPLIHLCLQQERGELMRYLLDRGASVNCGDIYGNSLLVEVVKRRNFELAKMLVLRGADVNGSDYTGKPVVLVVMTDDKLSTAMKLEMLEPLCKRGARCSVADNWSVTALDHAIGNFTKGETANVSRSLGGAELRIVELLLTNGANADQKLTKQAGNPTLLTFAMERQDWELARLALTRGSGAKPNHADAKGRTPLLMALLNRKLDIAGLLLQKGADVSLAGTVSPMELAIALHDEGMMRLFGLLPRRTESTTSTGTQQRNVSTASSHVELSEAGRDPQDDNEEDAPPQYAAI